jgi:hypothetical protein
MSGRTFTHNNANDDAAVEPAKLYGNTRRRGFTDLLLWHNRHHEAAEAAAGLTASQTNGGDVLIEVTFPGVGLHCPPVIDWAKLT